MYFTLLITAILWLTLLVPTHSLIAQEEDITNPELEINQSIPSSENVEAIPEKISLSGLKFARKFKLIENFEDANFTENPKWWTFGNTELTIQRIGDTKFKKSTEYVLGVRGKTKEWYVGGMGTYIPVNGADYEAISIKIRGHGEQSGIIRIELYDDDNNNPTIEPNPEHPEYPLYDDRFVSNIIVNWTGWKEIVIPFTYFYDDNPKVGNDRFDPDQSGRSAGLAQVQLIFLAAERKGNVQFEVDDIKYVKY